MTHKRLQSRKDHISYVTIFVAHTLIHLKTQKKILNDAVYICLGFLVILTKCFSYSRVLFGKYQEYKMIPYLSKTKY